MMTFAQRLTRTLDAFATAPFATLLAIGFTIVWLACGFTLHFSEAWLLAMSTTSAVVTLIMVFVIANAGQRNTAALHLKIDMLVEAHPELSNRAVGVEHKPEQHIYDLRDELHARVSQAEREEAGDASTVT